MEPAVWLEGGQCRLGIVVVSAHDIRSAREDFTIFGDPQFDARKRASDRTELGPAERVDCEHR